MKNILILTLNRLKITFKNKSSYIFLFIVPIIFISFNMAFVGNSSSKTISIGLLDLDKTKTSRDLYLDLKSNEKTAISEIKKNDIKSKISRDELYCAIMIPSGFEKSIYNGSPKNIEVVSVKGDESIVWVKSQINSFINNLNKISSAARGDKSVFADLSSKYLNNRIKFQVKSLSDTKNNKQISLQGLGVLITFMMVGASLAAETILEEKRKRVFFRICSAPVSSKEYILGNIVTNLILNIIQLFFVLLFTIYILRMNTFIPFWELVITLAIFGLTSISAGLVIVSFSKNTQQSNVLMNLIITPSCMLAGCLWPIGVMPEYLQKFANFLPQKWALDALRKLQTGHSIKSIIMEITILIAFALAFFLIAAYRFSKTNDVKSFV